MSPAALVALVLIVAVVSALAATLTVLPDRQQAQIDGLTQRLDNREKTRRG